MDKAFPLVDIALARRLERAEAMSNVGAVEARARAFPDSGATWTEVAGAYAMFDGPESPITQTFGLGLFQPPTSDDFAAIEAFYGERGSPVFHEVSPLADTATVSLLNERRYQPFEFTSVMYRPTADPPAGATSADRTSGDGVLPGVSVRRAIAGDTEIYARTAADGWREFGYGEFMFEMARVNAASEGIHLFLAELDGRAIATAALVMHDGVAHLAGASTIPDGRRRGAQNALLECRLRYAAGHGCDIALMGALPGSGSQRNAERNGFRIAYTRVKWRLA
jgi:GNAT superfamily N-acetyltransferase